MSEEKPQYDSHDLLMKAFKLYFEANGKWEMKNTRAANIETRHWLSEIRRIAKMRREQIMNDRKNLGFKSDKTTGTSNLTGDDDEV